ncbi:hypothetical protein [Paraburkholderia phenazinium]|uniref:hypothetical protein n=1 Tax=Paraburkholderia phenazinium TaxID=60549 RepID=UPI00158B45C7|nr:hypothetical protein [Paraburkholderia phenazinium]
MQKLILFVIWAVLATSVHAATSLCSIAGHYVGKYDGPADRGTISADVSATDGVVTGEARSALHDQAFKIGGVVNDSGVLTANGAVGSGAAFSGRFLGGYASGQWVNGDGDGTWGLIRKEQQEGCE